MDESKIFGVSWRGWLAFIMISTVCAMALLKIEVVEPLYSLTSLAIGFYFGSKTQKK